MSILVEAGGEVNNSFLPYVDKLYHFIAPKFLGDNNGNLVSMVQLLKNMEIAQIFILKALPLPAGYFNNLHKKIKPLIDAETSSAY